MIETQTKQHFADSSLTPGQRYAAGVAQMPQPEAAQYGPDSMPVGEYLDSLLDPEHTLPHVAFAEDNAAVHAENPTIEGGVGYRVADETGRPLGVFIMGDGEEVGASSDANYLKWVCIGQDFQGHGYGKAIYRTLLEQGAGAGKTLVSDRQLSHDGMRMWQRLVRLGLAKQTVEYRYDAEGDDFLADSSIFKSVL